MCFAFGDIAEDFVQMSVGFVARGFKRSPLSFARISFSTETTNNAKSAEHHLSVHLAPTPYWKVQEGFRLEPRANKVDTNSAEENSWLARQIQRWLYAGAMTNTQPSVYMFLKGGK
jgi:hypothetical protein